VELSNRPRLWLPPKSAFTGVPVPARRECAFLLLLIMVGSLDVFAGCRVVSVLAFPAIRTASTTPSAYRCCRSLSVAESSTAAPQSNAPVAWPDVLR
jgi:hypothetical protein